MLRKVILGLSFFLILSPAFAQIQKKECLDNETLQIKEIRVYHINNDTYNVSQVQTRHCGYGCIINESRCRPSPAGRYISVLVVFAIIVGLVFLGLNYR